MHMSPLLLLTLQLLGLSPHCCVGNTHMGTSNFNSDFHYMSNWALSVDGLCCVEAVSACFPCGYCRCR